MIKINQLFIYPIKSLRGISVESSLVTDRGLQFDRRWMLIDDENRFLTLREYPQLSLLQPTFEPNGLRIKSLKVPVEDLLIPFEIDPGPLKRVTIWNAVCNAYPVGDEIDKWFTHVVGIPCKLAYMPDESKRPVDTSSGIKPAGKFTSFSDAYPFLLMSEESIQDLNKRSGKAFTIERFRPNLVIKGGLPYSEDDLIHFKIGKVTFEGLEKCARCAVPNLDPETGITDKDQEPTRTLSSYRRQGNHIYLGMNLVHSGSGMLRVGDELII
ncbi:MAG: MOSC domain-containing protein [Saprospiraceae bacterium]|nr:MOSC domain-containing protein [Saprospiraceae bacterium]